MANWACLPHDLLVFTAGLLKKFEDFAAFRAVCKTWNAAAANRDYFKELWLRESTPFLLLPARRNEVRDLYSWSEGNIVAPIRVSNSSSRKCFESLGWFLAVGEDGSLCLLDPFSLKVVEIPLPREYTFIPDPCESVRKMVLSARPDESTDFVVAIIYRKCSDLAFLRSGETSWRIIKPGEGYFVDVTYHSGLFYSLDSFCKIRIHNFVEGQVIASPVAIRNPQLEPLGFCYLGEQRCMYITKTDEDSLLLVIRKYDEYNQDGSYDKYDSDEDKYGECYIKTRKFDVYEFNFPLGLWRKIDNLGNMAIFVSNVNATTAVDASRFHGVVKPNHIYFMDDCHPYEGDSHLDRGSYNMENQTIDSFFHEEEFRSKTSRPTWIIPMLWSLSP